MTEPFLSMRDVSVQYATPGGAVQAVAGVTLDVAAGECVGIVGESGSGKSTLALAVIGLLPAAGQVVGGSITCGGRDLTGLTESDWRQIRGRTIAMVFQKAMSSLSPVHRIRTHFVDAYRAHRPGATAAEAEQRAVQLFTALGLRASAFNAYPHELSGGMLQRIMIALALLHDPELLILDEATTALDVVTQGQVLQEVARLQKQLSLTTLVITHDIGVVAALCDRIVVMYAGRVMESGPVADVLTNPRHPYTAAFVQSFPRLSGDQVRLDGIPGSLPDLADPPPGCVFAPRCPAATPQCGQAPPNQGSDSHHVFCHFPLTERGGAVG